MRTQWTRLWASRQAGWALWSLSIIVVLLVFRWPGRFTNLQAAVAVAAVLVPATAWLDRRRQGGIVSPDAAAQRLAVHVLKAEQELRRSLLGDVVPANVGFDIDQPDQPSERSLVQRLVQLVRFRDERGGPARSLDSIAAFYASLPTRRLVILGEPGAGKTVLAIELVVRLLAARRVHSIPPEGSIVPGDVVPVRLSAAAWDPRRPLQDWLRDELRARGLSSTSAQALVEDHRVLLVLDGLDEMDPNPLPGTPTGPPRRAVSAIEQLNDYPSLYGLGLPAAVLTCRQQRYAQLLRRGLGLRDATCVRIVPLTVDQIRSYIAARFRDEPAHRAAWQGVLDGLDTPQAAALRTALSTPWRLHLATVLSQQTGRSPEELLRLSADQTLPQVGVQRIDQVLLEGYVPAATALAKPGARGRRYDSAQVTTWLCSLAAHLDWQAAQAERMRHPPPGMTGIDIVPHLLWPVGGRWRVVAAHTVLALAVALASRSALASTAIEHAWRAAGSPPLATPNTLEGPPVDATPAILEGAVVVIYLNVLAGLIPPWPRMRLGARWTSRGSQLAAYAGTVFFGSNVFVSTVQVSHRAGLNALLWPVGLTLLCMAGFAYVLRIVTNQAEPTLWSQNVDLSSPRSPLRRNLARGIAVALPVGLFTVALWGLGFLGVAVCLFLLTARQWIRYVVGLAIAAFRTRMPWPWQLGPFLDWSCKAGLLRVAGASYQFRHLELQRWLADRQPGRPESTAPYHHRRVREGARNR